jgi:hypothetical protein
LVVSPTINNVKVTKMLVDGGSGLNLISAKLLRQLQIPTGRLRPTGAFQGVSPGVTLPLGQVTLPVTFGTPANFRTESVVFDVADTPLPYNGILGRPALFKFMAASHYGYNVLKIPAEWGVIVVKSEMRDAVWCVEQAFRAMAIAPGSVAGPRTSDPSPPRKRLLLEGSQLSRKVPLLDDGSHPVTIGAGLSDK